MSGSIPTREIVESILNSIIDPCSEAAGNPVGLVDMGLIRDLCVEPADDGRVNIRASLCLTEPGCLMGIVFLAEARKRLAALNGVADLSVEMAHGEEWHPSDIRGPAAARMQNYRSGLEARVPVASLGFLQRRNS